VGLQLQMKKNRAFDAALGEARAAWRRGEQESGVRQARRVFDEFSRDPRAVTAYAEFCLSTQRDPSLAISVLQEGLAKFENAQIFQRLVWYLARAGHVEEAASLAQRYLGDPVLGALAHLSYAGASLLLNNDLDAVVEFFRRAAGLPHCGRHREVAAAITSSADFRGLCDLDVECHPVTFVNAPPTTPRFVWCASADESYFRAFFQLFCDSFFAHNEEPATILHFHLLDPSDELREEITSRGKEPRFSRVCFSFENTGRANRSYYYVGRFVQLPRLLARYECPIAVSDIDCAFTGNIGPLVAAISGSDLGHLDIDCSLLPWLRFKAGLSVVQPTIAGYTFAAAMRGFLLQASKDTNFWWFDQAGLAQCVYLSRGKRFGNVIDITSPSRKVCFFRTHQKTGHLADKANALRRHLHERRSESGEELETTEELTDE
jgi:hypothetical protein